MATFDPKDRLVLDHAALRRLLAGPQGDVAKDLGRRAIRVETEAKLNATGRAVAGATNQAGRGPKVDTGRLRSSISWRLGQDGKGIYAEIGSAVPYALYLETGLRNGTTFPFLLPALAAAR